MTYWLQQSDPDPHDLDQVGLTLLALGDNYLVAGTASQDGVLTVRGINPGDQLTKIDAMKVTGASRDGVLSALHRSQATSALSQSTKMERRSPFRHR